MRVPRSEVWGNILFFCGTLVPPRWFHGFFFPKGTLGGIKIQQRGEGDLFLKGALDGSTELPRKNAKEKSTDFLKPKCWLNCSIAPVGRGVSGFGEGPESGKEAVCSVSR